MPQAPSVKLLASFGREAKSLKAHKRRLSDPLKADKGIVESVQQIFRQVLGESLGISVTSFSQDEKEEVLAALDSIPDDESREYLTPFVDLFGELCDQWPDVIDISYGGGPADFREFRVELVPGLLEALEEWANYKGREKFASRVKTVLSDYQDALAEVRQAASDDEWEE